ncbi:RNB domain-containing ribonuclease [Streptomyces spectabilis]|uniref:Exoribonuclease R n=1 Tax=Streptomyces spectabilis TaxID=68270 RepID=A0A5P2X3M7_STRST|nr:RNB domain-containing ribonuclease [Streptomyces spectabilis]MBB5103049.1 exoribonuclease R [Streptomyces spectabilis]MCI3902244.1 RNB domain-containing ribonuclease [Streptomyces spectabilis]QEV59613.1 RNB domain-containing ribonuclease [Streptomyces spectabilis]GGV15075.1 exoribonuclease R [Streptomyces spectabilis]
MPRRHLRVTGAAEAPLRAALRDLRARLDVPEKFPAEALRDAERAAAAPRLPDEDATGIPFFTIDPPTSVDLDQAMHLSRRAGGGYRVRYAIADVAAYVTPKGPLDTEAHRRVTTLYFPDEKVPLHPTALSEGAASLLPDQTCPALVWSVDLDADGRTESADVRRALVRSRAKLDYDGVQRDIDAGTAEEPLALLADIGRLRERLEVERGGISLDVPEQEIVEGPGGDTYELVYRAPLPADGWNAQISLLTGMAAAQLMIDSGTGVLRTLPTAPDGAVGRLRRTARALDIDWPHHVPYAALVRSLDPRRPHHAAFLQECTTLLRGAGYTAFSGGEVPDLTTHAAVAAPYAHCTAPLRRLVDRYASELCLAACADAAPPEWVLAALPALPKEMAEGTRRGNAVERACVDIVEAALLKDRVGEVFDAVVVDVKEAEPAVGTVQLTAPAVVARIEAGTPLPLGERLRVRLARAEPGEATVLFTPA